MRKILVFIFALIALLFLPTLAFAKANNTPVILPVSQTVNHNYFGAGPTVDVEGTVNGDAYLTGGTILVNGNVNGDVLAGGGQITIKGTVHNVRVAGGQVQIDGTVTGNVTVLGGSITLTGGSHVNGSVVAAGGQILLNGPIGKTITVGGGSLIIGNSVGGDASLAAQRLTLTSGAKIHGNLWFESQQSAQIDKGAVVTGKITHMYPPRQQNAHAAPAFFAGFGVFAAFAKLVLAIVIGMLLLALVPLYSKRVVSEIRDHFWPSFGIGLLAWMLTPFIVLALFITLIGIPLALATIFAFVILSYIGKLYAALFIGWWAMERVGQKHARTFLAFLVGIILFEIIGWIPLLGWLFSVFFSVIGFGAVLLLKKSYYTELRAKKLI